MFMILENFREFDKGGDFPKDEHHREIRCDGCAGLSEQYMVIEKGTFCKGCLERCINLLNKNFLDHCKDDWNKRVKEEENGRI